MKNLIIKTKNHFFISILILISLAIYFILISTTPLAHFSSNLSQYSNLLFFAAFGAYLLSFRINGNWGILAGVIFTLAALALVLLNRWSSGYSDNNMIGGLLPYKDAKYYYLGTQTILDGSLIANTSINAAWRPIFPGFLAIFMSLTQGNLQWALALIFACAGFCIYLTARQIFHDQGIWSGALLATFLYLYIRPFIGYVLSESAGFIFGCLAFVALWNAAKKLNVADLLVGLALLTLANSIRSGAFFMLPMLIFWSGWAFRGEKRFSYLITGASAMTVMVAFAIANVIYPRLMVEPGAVTFGNFAYSLYGQVHGGIGWHKAIEAMGQEPGPILKASLLFFFEHPFSFFIAAAKSYRDFFFTDIGLFEFMFRSGSNWNIANVVLWAAKVFLLAAGIARVILKITKPIYSFLAASFIGIFISIPFLPPIDGGSRFYAGSVVFMFALASIGAATKSVDGADLPSASRKISGFSSVSIVLAACLMVLPVIIQISSRRPVIFNAPVCDKSQKPFVARVYPGTFIDLVGVGNCGLAPQICLADFAQNGTDKTTDDFYQALVAEAGTYEHSMRVALFTNLLGGDRHYLIGTPEQIEISASRLVTGCATHIRTKNQSIYKIQNVTAP